ncbi:hypothetical protein FSST1_000016 [Fusarium sambucinum]
MVDYEYHDAYDYYGDGCWSLLVTRWMRSLYLPSILLEWSLSNYHYSTADQYRTASSNVLYQASGRKVDEDDKDFWEFKLSKDPKSTYEISSQDPEKK